MAKKVRELTPLMVRLPEPLRRKLARKASTAGRSMNAEIIRRLEDSVAREDPLSPDARALLSQVDKRLVQRSEIDKRLAEHEEQLMNLLRRLAERGET